MRIFWKVEILREKSEKILKYKKNYMKKNNHLFNTKINEKNKES